MFASGSGSPGVEGGWGRGYSIASPLPGRLPPHLPRWPALSLRGLGIKGLGPKDP